CWQTTTPHDRMRWALRAVDTGLDPAHYQPDPDLSEQAVDEEQEPQLPLEQAPPTAARTVTKKAASVPKAPAGELVTAVVVDSDGVWFPDGHREDLPTPLTHVGHLADLGIRLGLGTRFSQRRVEPGQVWVTDSALRE